MIVLRIVQRRGWEVRTQDWMVLFPFNFLLNFRFNFGEPSWKSNKVSQNIQEMKRNLIITNKLTEVQEVEVIEVNHYTCIVKRV